MKTEFQEAATVSDRRRTIQPLKEIKGNKRGAPGELVSETKGEELSERG